MKKDIVIAIGSGFFVGAIFALVITNLPKVLKEGIKVTDKSITPTAAPYDQVISGMLDFTIDKPKEAEVTDEKTIEVAGRAKAGHTILIETALDQQIVAISQGGSFSAKLNLTDGANNIYLTVYDESGNPASKDLTVYYTAEKL